MNLTLNAVFICFTNNNKWGKGYSPTQAKVNAGLTSKAKENKVKYQVMAAVFNHASEEEIKNLCDCITANPINGGPQYYEDRTKEDNKMIKDKHVGWLMVEKNY
jgi:hypothetical protein